mgnify:CR=1 FL=1
MGPNEHYSISVGDGGDEGDEVIVQITGEVDLGAVDDLTRCLDEARATGGRLVIDASGITFIDSSGLHALVRAVMAHQASGFETVLRNPSPSAVRLIDLTGVEGALTIENDSNDD